MKNSVVSGEWLVASKKLGDRGQGIGCSRECLVTSGEWRENPTIKNFTARLSQARALARTAARLCFLFLVFYHLQPTTRNLVDAQSTNAVVGGQITDQAGRSVPGAAVVLTNLNTNIPYSTTTNDQGIYSLPNLPPGIYRENISKDGFKSIVKGEIELHVQDNASINFQMQVGSVTETVTVEGGAPLVNTTDGSVSTVVDRTFIQNIPLNGRSLQSLLAAAPGVVAVPGPTNGRFSGEFSVNGQRTEANYYTVDGLSANSGSFANSPLVPGAAGNVPGESALFTTLSH